MVIGLFNVRGIVYLFIDVNTKTTLIDAYLYLLQFNNNFILPIFRTRIDIALNQIFIMKYCVSWSCLHFSNRFTYDKNWSSL